MDRKRRIAFGLLAVGVIGVAVAAFAVVREPSYVPAPLAERALAPNIEFVPVRLSIRRGDNLENLLARAGADRSTRVEMIAAVRDAFDVKKFRAGSEITLTRTRDGQLNSLEYTIDPDHKLKVSQTDEIYSAEVEEIPGTIITAPVCASLEDSLFASIERAGERPDMLAIRMAEIFAWDIDFYTDPQRGDEFCLLVEKKVYVNGQEPTYKRILAAKYVNSGTPYDAFLFPDKEGNDQYYSSDGKSLKSAFLRSPMKFDARVSSRFSHNRFHPILKIHRPHLGTDYAAPRGTPVQAVASGRVTFSGYSGGSGNLVKIKHSNGFETMYMHLSKRYVKRGQKVAQGRRIGTVGSTGLSTGAHLDFRIRKNGKYLNPEKLKPPRTSKIPADQIATFNAERELFAAMMEPVYGPSAAPAMLRAD
jgi:murein DD-endopeptidase MepM/ murein hydrolase activator NlpD